MSSDKVINAILNVANLASENPQTLTEARESPNWLEWEKAIQTELDQLQQKNTWILADVPEKQVPVKNKWVFVKKYDKEGLLMKYKA